MMVWLPFRIEHNKTDSYVTYDHFSQIFVHVISVLGPHSHGQINLVIPERKKSNV